MFEGMAKAALKSSINSKAINNKLILNEKEIIDLINKYTDNEYIVKIGNKFGNNPSEYYDIELSLEKK